MYYHIKNLFSGTMYLVDKSRVTKMVYTINICKESSFLYWTKLAIGAASLYFAFNAIDLIIDVFVWHGLCFGCLSDIRLIYTAIEINCILYACLFNFVFCRHGWGKENVWGIWCMGFGVNISVELGFPLNWVQYYVKSLGRLAHAHQKPPKLTTFKMVNQNNKYI